MNESFQVPGPESRNISAMFVKLTGAVDNTPIYINVNMVISFYEREYEGRKITELYVGECGYRVKELPERVMELIWQARR